jgi:hypothetical protein
MVKFILSRLHPRPERRGFTLHMDKNAKTIINSKFFHVLSTACFLQSIYLPVTI